VSFAE
jgi:hypothetical protein